MRSGDHDTAPGPPTSWPPSDSHGCQLPSYQRCQRAPSLPRPKASRRPAAHDVTSGAEVRPPVGCPRFSNPCHPDGFGFGFTGIVVVVVVDELVEDVDDGGEVLDAVVEGA